MSQTVKNKPRLGRGLSSLISVSNLPVEAEVGSPTSQPTGVAHTRASDGSPLLLPIDSIRPNPHQPRKTINETSISELAASMKSSGIIQPLVVRHNGDGYEL